MSENRLERKHINFAEIHDLFNDLSIELGFSEQDILQYSENLAQLIHLWESQQHVEIYSLHADRVFGRAKDSSLSYGSSPYYIGLYHARLDVKENDPLIVLTFHNENDPTESYVSIRFMVDHDTLFGKKEDKYLQQRMKSIRKRIDDFIQLGN